MDEALIVVSVVSGLFTMAGISLLNHNWFKRETFKFENNFHKKKYDLELKKMARDMGLNNPSSPLSNRFSGPPPGPSSNILDLAKNLSPDQLAAVADILGGGGSEEIHEGGGLDGIGGLIEFAKSNPDIVKGFLSGLQKKGGEGGSGDGFM